MEVVLFIPGILGSKLLAPTGAEIWPPTPIEALTGYGRISELLRDDLQPGEVIRNVCIDVYGGLLEALETFGYRADDPNLRLIPFGYDWRRDIRDTATKLDAQLTQIVQSGPGVEIKLICHSMGGLVARACLESAHSAGRPWATAVKLAVFLATPHDGAPLAFARAIGVGGSTLGLSQNDLRRLSSAPGYPSAYQLFPPERLQPIWELRGAPVFTARSVFDPSLGAPFGLNASHLLAATALHAALDITKKPLGCRYFSIISAAHETVARFDRDGGALGPVSLKATGDGTVPFLSAAALPIQTAFVEADHVGVTQKLETHRLLGMLLGRTPPAPVPAFAPGARVSLSTNNRFVAEGEEVEVVIAVSGVDEFDALLRITRGSETQAVAELPIAAHALGLARVELRTPRLGVGLYVLELVVGGQVVDREELLVTA